MKIKQFSRWKIKQKNYNQKYKLKSFKRSSQTRNYNGKFLFLISGKNLCTILKFITKNSCVTETALIVDDSFIRQLSKKVLITTRRNRKVLRKCEVMISKNYKDAVLKLVNITKAPVASQPEVDNTHSDTNTFDSNFLKTEEDLSTPRGSPSSQPEAESSKNITPIKILSCEICIEEFIDLKDLEHHYQTIHKLESEDETGSDALTEQDIDEMISDPNFVPIHPKIVIQEYDMSLNSAGTDCDDSLKSNATCNPFTLKFLREEDKPEFKCRICSLVLSSRGFLNRHMLGLHILNVYKCYKCKVAYEYKQKLVNHLKLAHKQYENEAEYISSICDPEPFSTYHCCFCKYSSLGREIVVEHMLGEHYDEFDMDNLNDTERQTSSPDSLNEILLPENRAKLLGFIESKSPRKSFNNNASHRFRCARCKRQFSRKYLLKDHVCAARPATEFEQPTKSHKNLVNGFYHCTHTRCSQVYTNKVLYDIHLALDHSKE